MPNTYRVRYKHGDFEIEVESSEKKYVDDKLAEMLESITSFTPQNDKKGSEGPRSERRAHSVSRTQRVPSVRGEDARPDDEPNLVSVVAKIHESDNFKQIEKHILGKNSQLGRVLLCFYSANKFLGGASLTTGQVETITNELGSRIKAQNVLKVIKREAKKYLTADRTRRQGATTKYKINRQGVQAFERLLKGEAI